ncbi:MAG: hypothetical protein L3J31_01905 [Bacteroidales bacterium]|nr:hypothetical protein [Bacteroidales bacterium]
MRNFNIVFAIALIMLAWACAWLLVSEPDQNQLTNRPHQAEAQPSIDSDDVETPDKAAYIPPEQPTTTGKLAEKFFKNPKTTTIQMLNRQTGEPITARAKLWPMNLVRRRIAESYDDDEKVRPVRRARPDAD